MALSRTEVLPQVDSEVDLAAGPAFVAAAASMELTEGNCTSSGCFDCPLSLLVASSRFVVDTLGIAVVVVTDSQKIAGSPAVAGSFAGKDSSAFGHWLA